MAGSQFLDVAFYNLDTLADSDEAGRLSYDGTGIVIGKVKGDDYVLVGGNDVLVNPTATPDVTVSKFVSVAREAGTLIAGDPTRTGFQLNLADKVGDESAFIRFNQQVLDADGVTVLEAASVEVQLAGISRATMKPDTFLGMVQQDAVDPGALERLGL